MISATLLFGILISSSYRLKFLGSANNVKWQMPWYCSLYNFTKKGTFTGSQIYKLASFTLFLIGEEGQNVSYTQVRRTRGITQGLGTQALINACKHRIPIRTNGEHKLPQTVRANIKFRSEIGIQTRQNAPLMVKRWKEVSAVDKATITKALAVSYFNIFLC